MTRNDFEALLWSHLAEQLPPTPNAKLLAATGVTPEQWAAFTDGELENIRAALHHVKSHVARHVWDVNA